MEKLQIIVTAITAVIPAIISYFVARYQGKTDIKKLSETSKSEIDRLIKQHEINLEALKEKHRLEMEAKDKEQEYKLPEPTFAERSWFQGYQSHCKIAKLYSSRLHTVQSTKGRSQTRFFYIALSFLQILLIFRIYTIIASTIRKTKC